VASGTYLEIIAQDNLPVAGESEASEYEGHIDIAGWDWGVTDNASKKTGASTGSTSKSPAPAKASVEEVGIEPSLVTFSKPVDSATTRLMKAMCFAEKFKEATFTVREELVSLRDSDDAFVLHVRLEKPSVTSYKLTGRSQEHRVDLEETWTLNYEHIEFLYQPRKQVTSAGKVRIGAGKVQFERPPGSEKRGSEKAAPDPAQLQKQVSELKQQVAAGKGGKAG